MEQNQSNNQNLNLLSNNIYKAPVAVRIRSKLVLFTKIIVIAIEIIFLLTLFMEFRSNQAIKNKLESITAIEKLYAQKGFDEGKIRNLLERITYYKELKAQSKSGTHSDKLQLILSHITPVMKILTINSTTLNEIFISVETQNALAISLFIDSILKSESVNEVYLEQVNFIAGEDKFAAEMVITFK